MKTLTKTAIGLSAAGAAGAAYVLIKKSRSEVAAETRKHVEVHGFVSAGFEAVRDAFAENFSRRRELGAACCVYHGLQEHEIHHRAQLNTYLRLMGITPPSV